MADPAPRNLLLDANVLLFWLAGLVPPGQIGPRWPRAVQHFDRRHHLGLGRLVVRAVRHVTIPHVLAECSNLLTKDVPSRKAAVLASLQQALGDSLTETATSSRLEARVPDHLYLRHGLTDALLLAMDPDTTVVTDDADLRSALGTRSILSLSLEQAAQAG